MSGFSLLFNLIILIFSAYLLSRSANFLITTITRVGFYLGLSQFITGFVLLGMGTSIPEISVGISSAMSGTPQLSVGNLLGADIVLLTLITGLAALLSGGVAIKKELTRTNRMLQILLLIGCPIVLLVDAGLTRLDALLLILVYCMYMLFLSHTRPKDSPPLSHQLLNTKFINSFFLSAVGIIGVVLTSKAVVISAENIAQMLHVSDLLVGALILSVGTNLPEISIVIASLKQNRTNLVIGDVLGSAATNTLIMGMVGMITPFKLGYFGTLEVMTVFLLMATGFFYYVTRTKDRISVGEGIILISLYATYVINLLLFTI